MFKRAISLSKTLPISYKRNLHITSIKMSDKKPEVITAYDVRSIVSFFQNSVQQLISYFITFRNLHSFQDSHKKEVVKIILWNH